MQLTSYRSIMRLTVPYNKQQEIYSSIVKRHNSYIHIIIAIAIDIDSYQLSLLARICQLIINKIAIAT